MWGCNIESDSSKIATEGIFGGEDHFDEYGKLVGFSTDGIFGGKDYYNTSGTHDIFSSDELLDTSTRIYYDTGAGIDPYSFDEENTEDNKANGTGEQLIVTQKDQERFNFQKNDAAAIESSELKEEEFKELMKKNKVNWWKRMKCIFLILCLTLTIGIYVSVPFLVKYNTNFFKGISDQ